MERRIPSEALYSLEKLSRIGLTDSECSCDQRYTALKGDVYSPEFIKRLSPPQLASACMSANRLKIGDATAWTLMLTQLTKISQLGGAMDKGAISRQTFCKSVKAVSESCDHMHPKFISAAISAFLRSPGSWNQKDKSCIFFFLRRISRTKQSMDVTLHTRLTLQLLTAFNDTLDQYSADQIACTLYDLSTLGIRPIKTIHRASNRLKHQLDTLSPKKGSLYITAMANFKLRKSLTIERISSGICISGTETDVCNALYATSKLRLRVQTLIRRACTLLADQTVHISNSCIRRVSYALGVLGVAQARKSIDHRFHEIRHCLSPGDIAKFLASSAKVSACPSVTFLEFMGLLKCCTSGLTPEEIISSLHAITKMGLFDISLVSTLIANLTKVNHSYTLCDEAKMSFVAFELALQSENIHIGASSGALLNNFNFRFAARDHKLYHGRLGSALSTLRSIQVLHCPGELGPYSVDAILLRDGQICTVDVLSESAYCPISGELLGWLNSKKRHLSSLGVFNMFTLRKRYMPDDINELANFLTQVFEMDGSKQVN